MLTSIFSNVKNELDSSSEPEFTPDIDIVPDDFDLFSDLGNRLLTKCASDN